MLRSMAGMFGLGADAEMLRARLRADYDANGITLTDSGTHALQVAITAALREAPGRGVVALPAFGCFDLATAALGTDAAITFYDVDPATLSPDWASLESALRAGARVVVIAPLYGLPVDWEVADQLGRSYGAIVIEDAAQGHGSFWREKRLGSLGRLSVLSFSRGKGWTGGAGGAVLSRDGATAPELHEGGGSFGDAVRLSAQWLLGRPSVYGIPRAIPFLGLGETVFRRPSAASAMSRGAIAALLANQRASTIEADAR
jgi:perosamine synthetase